MRRSKAVTGESHERVSDRTSGTRCAARRWRAAHSRRRDGDRAGEAGCADARSCLVRGRDLRAWRCRARDPRGLHPRRGRYHHSQHLRRGPPCAGARGLRRPGREGQPQGRKLGSGSPRDRGERTAHRGRGFNLPFRGRRGRSLHGRDQGYQELAGPGGDGGDLYGAGGLSQGRGLRSDRAGDAAESRPSPAGGSRRRLHRACRSGSA